MRPKLRGSRPSRALCKTSAAHHASQTTAQITIRCANASQRHNNTSAIAALTKRPLQKTHNMSLRYAALLAPACAFTHPQQPRRVILRRDYSSIDDVFDSMFDDAFDAWSPFGLSRRMRRRSPLAQQFGQLKRLSQAFEEQLQRVDDDDFLADTPLGQRRQLATPKEDTPKTDESTSSL